MDMIASKLKMLRNNKKLTQEEVAEVFAVSPQAVSKWENGISSPDISMLPQIARYYGISMDELFSYKLDALNEKERFLRFMVDNGVLHFGEFELQSGRISPYYMNTKRYTSASQITKLGQFYAKCINENNIYTDMLIGNSDSDLALAVATSIAMFEQYGIDVKYNMKYVIGAEVKKAKNITIISDTLTTGQTVSEWVEVIRQQAPDSNINVIVSLDRMEAAFTGKVMAKTYLEKNCGVKVYSIVDFEDVMDATQKGIVGVDYYKKLQEYQKQYGLKM